MKTLTLTDEQTLLLARILEQASEDRGCLTLTEMLGLMPDDPSVDWLADNRLLDEQLDDILKMF